MLGTQHAIKSCNTYPISSRLLPVYPILVFLWSQWLQCCNITDKNRSRLYKSKIPIWQIQCFPYYTKTRIFFSVHDQLTSVHLLFLKRAINTGMHERFNLGFDKCTEETEGTRNYLRNQILLLTINSRIHDQ